MPRMARPPFLTSHLRRGAKCCLQGLAGLTFPPIWAFLQTEAAVRTPAAPLLIPVQLSLAQSPVNPEPRAAPDLDSLLRHGFSGADLNTDPALPTVVSRIWSVRGQGSVCENGPDARPRTEGW